MSRRRAFIVVGLSLAVIVVHFVLVRLMAHGHVAHVLLGSGNAAPPLGAALLAVTLVLARLGAIVVAPGALLASAASLVAHAVAGPKDGYRDGGGAGDGSGTSSGTGMKSAPSGSGSAVAEGTGLSIEGRAT